MKEQNQKELDFEDLKKQLHELNSALEECHKLKEEYLAGWQRARADLLNYKKEEMERIGELLNYANEGLVFKILPILDNFKIAQKEAESMNYGKVQHKETIEGFLQIKEQILDFLKKQGLEEIESTGKKFDPNFHEVVEELEAENKEAGTILEEIQKGYTINGRLIRPAKVKIAKERS